MPELAEVEYYRRRWDPGIGRRILAVSLHPKARIFRGQDVERMIERLPGSTLLGSEAQGKRCSFDSREGSGWESTSG